ncbi:MAG: hypothetical protein RLZZ347_620 [Candidatus Parcubacteria bacterium]|jgi:hypothetical protein
MKTTVLSRFLALIFSVFALFLSAHTVLAVDTLTPIDPKSVGSTLEVHITDDGKIVLHGAQIIQSAGTTFYARSNWGGSYMRWVIRTDENTKVTRRFGTETTIAEIKPGDIVSAEGDFMATSDSISVVAKKVKDWSLASDKVEFGGVVTTIATSSTQFEIKTSAGNRIIISTTPDTSIIKGVIGIGFSQIKVGDKITNATGVYNHVSKVLNADALRVYQDKSVFLPRNFEGTIVNITGSSLPATMTVMIGTKNYTVELTDKTEVLNRKKVAVSLKRFFADDSVRLYGAIKQDNLTTITAEVVRNLDL